MSAQPGAPNTEQRHWIMSFFSRKQGVFWNVAAGAALLGAGYFAARFSSGEEEYEEGPSQQPIPLGRSDSLGSGPFVQEQMASQQGRRARRICCSTTTMAMAMSRMRITGITSSHPYTQATHLISAAVKPDWVDELLLKLEQVYGKLNEIKEAVNNRTKRASNNKDDSSNTKM